MGKCSLEEFTASLTEQGFELSSRGHNIYRNLQIPDRRFVIRQRVVRLERKDPERKSYRWRLDSSYLISSQLHLAKNALNNLNYDRTAVLERRALVALHWSIGAIAVSLVLSSWSIRNLLLFINASEPAYRPKGGMILFVSALVGGILMVTLGLIWWNDNKKFRRSSTNATAQVLGRQRVAIPDDDPLDRTYYQYYLNIGFVPSGLENSGQRIELRVRVKEKIYQKHLTGSAIMIQYAIDDPRIIILESE